MIIIFSLYRRAKVNRMNTSFKKAFLAEDYPPTRHLLCSILSELGIQSVKCFDNGDSLLRAYDVEEYTPDVILTDLQMPKVDGIELIRELSIRGYKGDLFFISGQNSAICDTALIVAKSAGYHNAQIITKPTTKSTLSKIIVKKELILNSNLNIDEKKAIDAALDHIHLNSFTNFYQPKVSASTGEIIGAEAFIRLDNPNHHHISPETFIPMIEQRGIINEVTLEVINRSSKDYKIIKPKNGNFKIAINLSADCLTNHKLPDQIASIITRNNMNLNDFIFEITESRAINQPILAMEILSRLRMMGAELSIDDFGTGFSSLKQLIELPFTELKVDQMFVTDAWTKEIQSSVLLSVLDMAKRLGVRSVTEGIESNDDLLYARKSGADVLQGYFISKPVASHDFIQQLNIWESRRENIWPINFEVDALTY